MKSSIARMAVSWFLLFSTPSFAALPFHVLNRNARLYRFQVKLDSGKFNQKLDHFDSTDTQVFSERFAIYTDFAGANPKSAPVLYYLCGEWTCTESESLSAISAGIADHAKALGAVVVVLEHRYYGQSSPFNDSAPEHMKYLSYEQALEDFANFQRYAMDQYSLHGKWISVGGSYPGALSAYYRQRYPDLVVGALSSSGVVRTVTAFEDYDRMVAEGLGSQCLSAVQNATAQVEASLSNPDQFAAMKELFNATSITDPRDLLAIPANAADGAVQYGMQTQFCKDVLSEDPLHGLAKASLNISPQFTGADGQSDDNSWQYQMCTQFGGFVVPFHDPAKRVQSALLDLNYGLSACKNLFGITAAPPTDETNKNFYEPLLDSSTSRIVFVNGSMDPYSVLSISAVNGNNTNPNTESDMVEGGSHCIDFYSALEFSRDLGKEIFAFQTRFQSIAEEWLK